MKTAKIYSYSNTNGRYQMILCLLELQRYDDCVEEARTNVGLCLANIEADERKDADHRRLIEVGCGVGAGFASNVAGSIDAGRLPTTFGKGGGSSDGVEAGGRRWHVGRAP